MSLECAISDTSHSVKQKSRAKSELHPVLWRGRGWAMPRTTIPHPERSKEAVGRRLVAAREALGLKAKQLCAELNVAENTWNQWEKGKRMADLLAMARLWDRHGIDLNFIFMGRTDQLPYDLAIKIVQPLDEPSASRRDDIAAAQSKKAEPKKNTRQWIAAASKK
jgi:transcriptional regulator with XRE-family HTH domain